MRLHPLEGLNEVIETTIETSEQILVKLDSISDLLKQILVVLNKGENK